MILNLTIKGIQVHGWMDVNLPVLESKPEDGQVQYRGEKNRKTQHYITLLTIHFEYI